MRTVTVRKFSGVGGVWICENEVTEGDGTEVRGSEGVGVEDDGVEGGAARNCDVETGVGEVAKSEVAEEDSVAKCFVKLMTSASGT
jgi:hypothetical protein